MGCTLPEVWTSGTTGEPKRVQITDAMLAAHREAAARRIGHTAESVWIHCLPPTSIGAVALLDRCAHLGGTVRDIGRFTLDAFVQALPGATHASIVPTMLHRIVAGNVPPPKGFQCLLVGGDALAPELASQALDAGWPVYATYGLTEACSQVATATPEELRRNPGTSGRPLDGVQLSIEDGRITVAGPTVAGGRYVTDDLGRIEEGRLYVEGRLATRIVTGGRTVDARDIERRLEALPGVQRAAVVGLTDATWGQVVGAVIQGALPDVVDWPSHLKPRRMVQAEVPVTSMGKVRRSALADYFTTPA